MSSRDIRHKENPSAKNSSEEVVSGLGQPFKPHHTMPAFAFLVRIPHKREKSFKQAKGAVFIDPFGVTDIFRIIGKMILFGLGAEKVDEAHEGQKETMSEGHGRTLEGEEGDGDQPPAGDFAHIGRMFGVAIRSGSNEPPIGQIGGPVT